MMHASATPPPPVRSSDPSACCVSRQYCSSGRSTHAEAGMPTMVSVVDAIYFKNHSRKAWPSLSRGISSRSNDGLPKATCPRSSRCSAWKKQFPSEGTSRTTTSFVGHTTASLPRTKFGRSALCRGSIKALANKKHCSVSWGPAEIQQSGRGALGGGSAPWEVQAKLQEPAPARPEGEWGVSSLLGCASQFRARRKDLMCDNLSPKVLALQIQSRNMLTTPQSSPFRPHGSSFRHCNMLDLPCFPVVSPGS